MGKEHKITDSRLVPKAILPARGFEEPENGVTKESPTCSKDSLRVIMAIIAQKKWSLNTIDIKLPFFKDKQWRDIYFYDHPVKLRLISFGS